MIRLVCYLSAATLLVGLGGCDQPPSTVAEAEKETRATENGDDNHAKGSEENGVENPSDDKLEGIITNAPIMEIKPGYYMPGPGYDRAAKILAQADVSIRLDPSQGIRWYDPQDQSWSTIARIEELKPRLEEIKTKHMITISTGKVSWDQEEIYVAKIAEYAEDLGFEWTIVTTDNAQGLFVSIAIHHDN